MSTDFELLRPETAHHWSTFEGAIKGFEDAWRRGSIPAIEDYLASGYERRQSLLVELVHIELELRLKSREAARVEEYLERYPELAGDRAAVLGLIAAEYGMRRRGESAPHLDDYLRRFPGFRDLLPEQVAKATVAGSGPRRGTAHWTVSRRLEALPEIHGYEILGELGRGGMGVVYKARQVRLNRLVALKMILSGDHAGPETAVRFLAEAEAVARLQHPQIVQIYAFGDQEGRPYFAMEYVAGGSLEDRLDGTPWPALEAGRLVETLARGIHEAHGLGIIHRDLKPANVLLTRDGTPKVADFGLAKWMDIEAGLTRTDHVLGSPSYMAPEQAEGGGKPIGPAADVYALGTILYELVTGRPPFKAATVLETLEQVRSSEPIPPGRLQLGLPRDLETICLKCLRKEPARRYATALELAQDLRRFAAGDPILARPISRSERAWRWCRREPAQAALAAALIAGFLGVATQWWRAERHLRFEVEAHRALQEANTRERQAGMREQEARRRAQERFQLGMKAVDGYSNLASEDELLKDPRLERLRKTLLGTALGFYTELQSSLECDSSAQSRSQLASAYFRIGRLHAEIGAKAEALADYRRVLAIQDSLVAADPADHPQRFAKATALERMGRLFSESGRLGDAVMFQKEALDIEEGLVRDHPEVVQYKQQLAWCLQNLGVFMAQSGRADQAVPMQRRVVEIRESLVREDPASPSLRSNLAWTHHDLGLALSGAGRTSEALHHIRLAVDGVEGVLRENSEDPTLRYRLANSIETLGRLQRRLGHPDSRHTQERSLAIFEDLARQQPTSSRFQTAWLNSTICLAIEQAADGRPDDVLSSIQRAEQIVGQHPDMTPRILYNLACAYAQYSAALRRNERALASGGHAEYESSSDRAMAALRRAITAGYANLPLLRRDLDLDPLRHRRDFQELLMDLSFPVDPFQNGIHHRELGHP